LEPIENAELVLCSVDGRVDPAGTSAFGQTQMCLQYGPPIKAFAAYAEVSSPATTASLTAPNLAWSVTCTCPVTTGVCTEQASPPSAGASVGGAATDTYRLSAALLKLSRGHVTLRARLESATGKPPAARLKVWLPRHGKTTRKLITTVTLTAARWRTFTARVVLHAGDHIIMSVVANQLAGLTALHTTLVATRKLGARS
jgi:hypothetical protein